MTYTIYGSSSSPYSVPGTRVCWILNKPYFPEYVFSIYDYLVSDVINVLLSLSVIYDFRKGVRPSQSVPRYLFVPDRHPEFVPVLFVFPQGSLARPWVPGLSVSSGRGYENP